MRDERDETVLQPVGLAKPLVRKELLLEQLLSLPRCDCAPSRLGH